MKSNVGKSDRILRIAIAILIAILYYSEILTGTLAYILLTVGAILVLTSLVSFCPLYQILGANTCKMKTN